MKTYFITGAAGFIGSNLAKRILKDEKDCQVICLDNMIILNVRGKCISKV